MIFANIVWPALFLEQRLLSWWAIGIGLFVELFFVWRLTRFSLPKAFVVNFVTNIASTFFGILLIPLSGIIWAIFPGILLYKVFDIGAFNPGTWAMTFALGVLINAAIEALVLRYAYQIIPYKRLFIWLCLGNSVSVGAAIVSLFIFPPKM